MAVYHTQPMHRKEDKYDSAHRRKDLTHDRQTVLLAWKIGTEHTKPVLRIDDGHDLGITSERAENINVNHARKEAR